MTQFLEGPTPHPPPTVLFSTQLTVGGRGRAHVHNSVMSLIRMKKMNELEKYTDIYFKMGNKQKHL